MPMEPPAIDLSKLDIERLIGDVAKRHNLLLRPDDPLFITVTLNELLLARALERIEAAVIASQDQIAAGTAQQIATAKMLGERLITAAAGHVAGQVREATGEAVDRISTAVAAELRAAREAANAASVARAGAWCAAAIAIAAAGIAATIAALSPLIDARQTPAQNSIFHVLEGTCRTGRRPAESVASYRRLASEVVRSWCNAPGPPEPLQI